MRGLIFYGMQGPEVQQLQRLLGLTPDGLFGPATQAAVVAFQKQHGLGADGIVGPQTWALLESGLPETLEIVDADVPHMELGLEGARFGGRVLNKWLSLR